jgi:hypothetical protein
MSDPIRPVTALFLPMTLTFNQMSQIAEALYDEPYHVTLLGDGKRMLMLVEPYDLDSDAPLLWFQKGDGRLFAKAEAYIGSEKEDTALTALFVEKGHELFPALFSGQVEPAAV